jgi:hypothetical protein
VPPQPATKDTTAEPPDPPVMRCPEPLMFQGESVQNDGYSPANRHQHRRHNTRLARRFKPAVAGLESSGACRYLQAGLVTSSFHPAVWDGFDRLCSALRNLADSPALYSEERTAPLAK